MMDGIKFNLIFQTSLKELMEPIMWKRSEFPFIATAESEEFISVVFLKDRLYSEEELPNEFKLFVPQSQKLKKVGGVTPNFTKQAKENNAQNVDGESEMPNKSEIPEESLQIDGNQEEVQNEEEDHMNPEASENVA